MVRGAVKIKKSGKLRLLAEPPLPLCRFSDVGSAIHIFFSNKSLNPPLSQKFSQQYIFFYFKSRPRTKHKVQSPIFLTVKNSSFKGSLQLKNGQIWEFFQDENLLSVRPLHQKNEKCF